MTTHKKWSNRNMELLDAGHREPIPRWELVAKGMTDDELTEIRDKYPDSPVIATINNELAARKRWWV